MHLHKNLFTTVLLAAISLGVPLALWAYVNSSTDTDAIPIGYVAQLEVSNYKLSQAGGTTKDPVTGAATVVPGLETLYQTDYERQSWSGDVHAYPLDAMARVYPKERWSAAAKLAKQDWDTGRYIATLNTSGTIAGIAFRGNLVSAVTTNHQSYNQTEVLNYLRGDNSRDTAHAGLLRTRSAALGDVLHSRPLYVADADNPTVFVGANDGMLHAFNASTGAERWAYVPSMLLHKLHTLAYSPGDSTQPFQHGYFVDGQINSGNITSSSGASIRALFGGLGAGGKGLYALDISQLADPGDETEVTKKALWEIAANPTGNSSTVKTAGQSVNTTADYVHLGYTYGTPLLVKIKTTQGTTSSYIDALIVGNGYDDTAAGTAHLYVIAAATGVLMKDFVVGPYAGQTGANGIFNPAALDSNNDGYVDTVYGADLNGSLWKFDLSAPWTSSASWTAPAVPLFSNKGSSGTVQPVTSSLGLAAHPQGGTMVTFGTGSALHGSYGTAANPDTHSVYGIWDGAPGGGTITPSDLLTQTLSQEGTGASRIRRASANLPNWRSGGHKGWKLALPAGERVVGEGGFIDDGRLYFSSHNPTVAPFTTPDKTVIYGENWLMALNYLTGGSNDGMPVGKWMSNGVQSQPILAQLASKNTTLLNQNPDAIYPKTAPRVDVPATTLVTGSQVSATSTSAQHLTPTNTLGTPNAVSLSKANAEVKSSEVSSGRVRTGRISWRELLRSD